jgi:hypothetical protein
VLSGWGELKGTTGAWGDILRGIERKVERQGKGGRVFDSIPPYFQAPLTTPLFSTHTAINLLSQKSTSFRVF